MGSGPMAQISTLRETEIAAAVGRLLRASDALHGSVGELEGRLMTVLVKEAGPVNPAPPSEGFQTPLGTGLNDVAATAERVNARLQSILARLEL
jgi:hypothetical protein